MYMHTYNSWTRVIGNPLTVDVYGAKVCVWLYIHTLSVTFFIKGKQAFSMWIMQSTHHNDNNKTLHYSETLHYSKTLIMRHYIPVGCCCGCIMRGVAG